MTHATHVAHHDDQHTHGHGRRQVIGALLGVTSLAVTVVMAPPAGLSPEGWRSAGAGMLMAIFWITEPIPIPVTALLPLVLWLLGPWVFDIQTGVIPAWVKEARSSLHS